jgi:hypothetical protein
MSVSSIKIIMDRISCATTFSPISVFVVPKGNKYELDAVFRDTYETAKRLSSYPFGYVGSFTKYDKPKEVEIKLIRAQKGLA